ncbi:MAG: hypothetical protein H0X02_13605 [Nitrosomonas sp.]|nr:hypothetical protein [Nitrosomonas sp.]
MPASGFYDWKLLAEGKSKQPFYVSGLGYLVNSFATA